MMSALLVAQMLRLTLEDNCAPHVAMNATRNTDVANPRQNGDPDVKFDDRFLTGILETSSVPADDLAKKTFKIAYKLSDYIDEELCRNFTGFHVSGSSMGLTSNSSLSRRGKRGQQMKGLFIFDTTLLQQRLNPQFHKFADLPTELRLMVWQLALPRKRVLTLREKVVNIISVFHVQFPLSCYPAVYSIFPLLHTCAEARTEALRYYKPTTFGKEWNSIDNARTYVDATFDTIYFGNNNNINFAELIYILNGLSSTNITSIALSTKICIDLSNGLSLGLYKDNTQVTHVKENLRRLKTAFCISSQDPKVPIHAFKISECPCGSVGPLVEEQIQVLEQFLGVKLLCGEILME
jgi:hypothetical protein